MTAAFSWVDLASLVVAVASLVVTLLIFALGKRLTFRQQRQRDAELEADAWKVLGPIRTQGLNSKIIVMNAARYARGYDGSNNLTWRGYAYGGPEIIDIDHGGIQVIIRGVETYFDADGRRTLAKTENPAPTAVEVGHIPWAWIEHINPEGDEFDGSAIFFVQHRAPGRRPYDYITFREGLPVPFGPNKRDYFRPIGELGTLRPRFFHDWWQFFKSMRLARRMEAARRRRAAP